MRVVAALVALSLAGCSWAFMAKPPDPPPPRHVPVRCSDSKALPVLDTIIAVPNGVLALAGLLILTSSDDDGDEVGEAIGDALGAALLIQGGLTALVYGLSARSGFRYADRCRQLQNQRYYQQWQPGRPGPPGWNQPPPGR